MQWITEDAKLVCKHGGSVGNVPSQSWVTVEGRRVLIEPDPEGRRIHLCPNIGATIKPCGQTLKVKSGYSPFITVDGKPVCLDSIRGLTDGTPPGMVEYEVKRPGQALVTEHG